MSGQSTVSAESGASVSERALLTGMRRELRAFEQKSTSLALGLVLIDVALYAAGFFWLALGPGAPLLRFIVSIALGIHITRFFILGHDAAHGSLTGSSVLNSIIGRIALLPSLHPYSLWQVGHNRVHHSFSNLKGMDFIWIPYSPREFQSLSRGRRALERIYRSLVGLGLYYFVEIWWKYLSPKGLRELKVRKPVFYADIALVLAFPALQIAIAPSMALWSVVLPFLVWNWIMGFIIYNHHTHPSARFFQNRSEWRFAECQIAGTVHVVFPRPAGLIFNNIMEHVAHHLNTGIPCYRLRDAQALIERSPGAAIIVEKWTWRRFQETLRTCQLYDYEQHRWIRFGEIR